MADHAINFMRAYAFTTPDKKEKADNNKDHLIFNLIKLSAYVPILGIITQIGVAIFICKENTASGLQKFAFISRAALSPVFPILAPLDFVGSIMYQIKKSKNHGINPFKT